VGGVDGNGYKKCSPVGGVIRQLSQGMGERVLKNALVRGEFFYCRSLMYMNGVACAIRRGHEILFDFPTSCIISHVSV